MTFRFKILIQTAGGEERWADANKVFAHLLQQYTKAELNGEKPEPYNDKVNNFFKLIDIEWLDALKKAYPNVDVDQELDNSKMWLLSNTSQAKSNFKKFVNNWMAKSMRNGKSKEPEADGRTTYKKHVVQEIPEEELASQEEINALMQGIKDKLRRK